MMKIKDFLTKNTWCQGHMAMNEGGDTVGSNSPSACKWCLTGVIYRRYRGVRADAVIFALARALLGHAVFEQGVLGAYSPLTWVKIQLQVWNDSPHRKWRDVKALVREANV